MILLIEFRKYINIEEDVLKLIFLVYLQAKLCMFPEGTRHCGPELLPFKKGAFHVAITHQCPIQPIVVSRYHFLDCKAKKFSAGKQIY